MTSLNNMETGHSGLTARTPGPCPSSGTRVFCPVVFCVGKSLCDGTNPCTRSPAKSRKKERFLKAYRKLSHSMLFTSRRVELYLHSATRLHASTGTRLRRTELFFCSTSFRESLSAAMCLTTAVISATRAAVLNT